MQENTLQAGVFQDKVCDLESQLSLDIPTLFI